MLVWIGSKLLIFSLGSDLGIIASKMLCIDPILLVREKLGLRGAHGWKWSLKDKKMIKTYLSGLNYEYFIPEC